MCTNILQEGKEAMVLQKMLKFIVGLVAILILKVVRCITIASYVRIPPWVKLDDSSSYVLYGCIKSSRSFLVKGVPIFTVGSLNLP